MRHAYAKATGGRRTVRRTDTDYYHASTKLLDTSCYYVHSSNTQYDDASRVWRMKIGAGFKASYYYMGVSTLVNQVYIEPDVNRSLGSAGSYAALDRFNRVVSDTWTKDLATDIDFYDVDIAWDRGGNILRTEDNVRFRFDSSYTNDALSRLVQATRGDWGGSSMTATSHDERWTLTHTGNWDLHKLDTNGDGDFTDAGELTDDASFNAANELTARDTDDNGTDDYTLVYDGAGNLTDDGETYKYVYDAFGRLRKVLDRTDDSLVAEYTYNALGYRIGWHYDVDADGTVESTSDDPWYHFAYDENWRMTCPPEPDPDRGW